MIRLAVDLVCVVVGVGVGFILGSAVRARRDRARAARQATIERFLAPRWDEHVDQALHPWREP
jgi:hypothetical protein